MQRLVTILKVILPQSLVVKAAIMVPGWDDLLPCFSGCLQLARDQTDQSAGLIA